jgi:hypothetical protein
MNHHVGQTADRNVAVGYLQKVLLPKFGSPLPSYIVHVVHTLGHYASTRFILGRAGITNILSTDSRVSSRVYTIRFADEWSPSTKGETGQWLNPLLYLGAAWEHLTESARAYTAHRMRMLYIAIKKGWSAAL